MKTLNTISKLKKGVALWTVLCGFITSASFAQTKEVDQELTQQITELVKTTLKYSIPTIRKHA